MHDHKMKPLQRVSSFHSWRSGLEKELRDGRTFATAEGPEVGSEMPEKMRRELKELKKKQHEAQSVTPEPEILKEAKLDLSLTKK
jgi:hypothetical protein